MLECIFSLPFNILAYLDVYKRQRWNGLNKSGGTIDALDDAEYSGSVISLIENGEAFIKRNVRMMWRKTANSREEMPESVSYTHLGTFLCSEWRQP